jgi:hypothetical protein
MQARVPLGLFGANASRLPTRLLIAGSLLVVVFPALGGLAAALGYPAASLPAPVVIVLGGLQFLIVLYAVMVVVQLAVAVGAAVSSAIEKWRRGGTVAATAKDDATTRGQVSGSMRRDLKVLTRQLTEMIWEQEQHGRGPLERAILGYVYDAVSTEIEHRRRRRELERRWGELETQTTSPESGRVRLLRRA